MLNLDWLRGQDIGGFVGGVDKKGCSPAWTPYCTRRSVTSYIQHTSYNSDMIWIEIICSLLLRDMHIHRLSRLILSLNASRTQTLVASPPLNSKNNNEVII
jgi:hypothetical protein